MANSPSATEQLTTIRLIKIIRKWRKQLLYVFLFSVVFSYILTSPLFMKPMFKSYAVIYPSNLQPYSKETSTEQLIQLINSQDVRDSVVKAFQLFHHYGIDISGAYPHFIMNKRLDENISVNKTQYESIEIDVYDTDPDTAALICNAIIHYTDIKGISLIRTRAKEQLVIAEKMLNDKKVQMDSMENAMVEIRVNYGITDFEGQVEGFSREYYRSLGSGGVNSKLEQSRKNLEEKGGEYNTLKEHLWKVRETYNLYKLKYESALTDMNKELEFHNIITSPEVPERKDSPKRAMLMIIFTLSGMLAALVVILYLEQIHQRLADELKN